VEAASDLGLAYMESRVGGLGGVVTVDPQGHWAARFSSPQMVWAAAQKDTLHYGLRTGEDFTQSIDDPLWHETRHFSRVQSSFWNKDIKNNGADSQSFFSFDQYYQYVVILLIVWCLRDVRHPGHWTEHGFINIQTSTST